MSDMDQMNGETNSSSPNVSKISLEELKVAKKQVKPVENVSVSEAHENPNVSKISLDELRGELQNIRSDEGREKSVYDESKEDKKSHSEVVQESRVENQKPSTDADNVKDYLSGLLAERDSKKEVRENNIEDKSKELSEEDDFDFSALIRDAIEVKAQKQNQVQPKESSDTVEEAHQHEGELLIQEQAISDESEEVQLDAEIDGVEKADIQTAENDDEVIEKSGEDENLESIDVSAPKVETTEVVSSNQELSLDGSEVAADQSHDQIGESEYNPNDDNELLEISDEVKQEAQKVVPSAKDIVSVTDDLVVTKENGSYTSNLDFTRNLSVRRYKIPLPKWPFIMFGGFAILAALIVSIFFIIEQNKPAAPVVLVSTNLNVSVIDAGFIGENLDLRGVVIECKYSDGSIKKVYNAKDYLVSTSAHFDSKGKIISVGTVEDSNNGVVVFVYEGNTMELKTNTYRETVREISDVRLESTTLYIGNMIKYEDLLVFVKYEKLGDKLLTLDECNDNLIAYIEGVQLEATVDGFIIPSSFTAGPRSLVFEYKGATFEAIQVNLI